MEKLDLIVSFLPKKYYEKQKKTLEQMFSKGKLK